MSLNINENVQSSNKQVDYNNANEACNLGKKTGNLSSLICQSKRIC